MHLLRWTKERGRLGRLGKILKEARLTRCSHRKRRTLRRHKVKVVVFAWKSYGNDVKHYYVKIVKDGVTVANEGSEQDRRQFLSLGSAVRWAESYVRENFTDCDIELDARGARKGHLSTNGRHIYLREGD